MYVYVFIDLFLILGNNQSCYATFCWIELKLVHIYIYAYAYIYMYVANRRKQQHEMWVCLNNYPKTATFNKAYDDKPTSTPCHLHLPHRLITKKNEP